MKKFFTLSLLMLSMLLTSGCCEDEPVIIVPEPEAAPPSVTGTISTNGGIPLEGVTVTVSSKGKTYTATTDDKGLYSVNVSDEGTYAVKAEKKGYPSKEDDVIAVFNGVSVWNVILPKSKKISAQVKKDVETKITVPIPPLVETVAGDDSLKINISTQSVSEDDSLILIVEYNESMLEQSKADQMMSLLVVRYYLASGNKLQKPIDISVETPVSPDQVLLNGEKIVYSFDPVTKFVKISTINQGALALNYYVSITEDLSGTTAVAFKQSVWDNFHGSAEMHVLNPEYTLKTGGSVKGNNSLLNSMAANYTGVPPVRSSYVREYPLDLTLPVGGKLILEGTQAIHEYNFSIANGLMHCTVSVHESAYITATTYNRQHSGGSD